ncbi:MAG: DUF2807 domain-containing protein [Patescibacteria group bacterium]|nr:DUF2807 domain-containing protein [Patescibacteria group bacterium]MDD5567148.1 DUF2807 domain-containing protein [Patescibacteria group bacterium]
MNQKGFISIIAIILIVAGAILVASYYTNRGSGNVANETRDVSNFKRISLSGVGNLKITQGDTEGLKIEAEDNLIKKIETKVEAGTLKIGYKHWWSFGLIWPTKDVNFFLTVKELEAITISGSGSIEAPALKVKNLNIEVNGSGKVNMHLEAEEVISKISGSGNFLLTGTTTKQELDISGSGSYLARDLKSKQAKVEISGSGKAELNVEEALNIKISGSGTVRYLGTPKIDQEISGSGKIERLE